MDHFENVDWNEDLIAKYNISGPRYTSYPTVMEFSDNVTHNHLKSALKNLPKHQPLSIYLHIPFCDTLCYYCACNKIVTRRQDLVERYLEALYKEIEVVGGQVRGHKVTQLHWGGGTPNFLSHLQILSVVSKLKECFELDFEDGFEMAMELDPRKVREGDLEFLKKLGFNRISLGIQDFNPVVQRAVNRVQPFQDVKKVVKDAGDCGFKSISMDLIYGLPQQTITSFNKTLDEVIWLSPDRISVFNYAHLPHRFAPQKRIQGEFLPSPDVKLRLLSESISKLQQAGYWYLGMDHFAKAYDSLSQVYKAGKLHRNFQGYTTHSECALIGLGVSAISDVNGLYIQNFKDLDGYEAAVEHSGWGIERGYQSNPDDTLRKHVILDLLCRYEVDIGQIEKEHGISFREYFANERQGLQELENDGLVCIDDTRISVTSIGRLLIRSICMTFDGYFGPSKWSQKFSKVI